MSADPQTPRTPPQESVADAIWRECRAYLKNPESSGVEFADHLLKVLKIVEARPLTPPAAPPAPPQESILQIVQCYPVQQIEDAILQLKEAAEVPGDALEILYHYRDFVRDYAAPVAPAPHAGVWQDMASAPKTERVLVFHPSIGVLIAVRSHLNKDLWMWRNERDVLMAPQPIAWMPLPAAPPVEPFTREQRNSIRRELMTEMAAELRRDPSRTVTHDEVAGMLDLCLKANELSPLMGGQKP